MDLRYINMALESVLSVWWGFFCFRQEIPWHLAFLASWKLWQDLQKTWLVTLQKDKDEAEFLFFIHCFFVAQFIKNTTTKKKKKKSRRNLICQPICPPTYGINWEWQRCDRHSLGWKKHLQNVWLLCRALQNGQHQRHHWVSSSLTSTPLSTHCAVGHTQEHWCRKQNCWAGNLLNTKKISQKLTWLEVWQWCDYHDSVFVTPKHRTHPSSEGPTEEELWREQQLRGLGQP